MEEYTFNGKTFKIHQLLRQKLDILIKLQEDEWDAIFLVDGIEGCGKSTLGITCAYYLTKGKMSVYNLCAGSEDAIEKLYKLPDGSVMVIDEGGLLFSSKEVMRREQIQLIKILNVIRQKRMILIIVSPSLFELNKYISVHRSRFLLHVYTDKKLKRGRFIYFGEKKKKILYEIGKKNFNSYKKPKASWQGNFIDFNPFEDEYKKVKKKSLMEALNTKETKKKHPQTLRKEFMCSIIPDIIKAFPITTQQELANALKMSDATLLTYKKGLNP